jgi:hypothetical protein
MNKYNCYTQPRLQFYFIGKDTGVVKRMGKKGERPGDIILFQLLCQLKQMWITSR